LRIARQRGEDFNRLLTRFAIERFLYRLFLSPAANGFCLKGALLFELWFPSTYRPTADADFLGLRPMDPDELARHLREACRVVSADGMVFDPESIRIREIREDARYGGLRAKIYGTLGSARCVVLFDIGFGDAVTPGMEKARFPVILNHLPAPRLNIYPRATVLAEKLEAIVHLGMTNTRLKDYYDLHTLAEEVRGDPSLFNKAVAATFRRRGTDLPTTIPMGLSEEFARDPAKQKQWTAFLRKNRLEAPPLPNIVAGIRSWATAAFRPARRAKPYPLRRTFPRPHRLLRPRLFPAPAQGLQSRL